MSFRTEFKWRVTPTIIEAFKYGGLEARMAQLFPHRIIRSTYFDDSVFSSFLNSEEGVLPREKLRLRWYNDEIPCTVEKKVSSIEGRFKTSTKYPNRNQALSFFREKFANHIKPVVNVSYRREYYKYKNLRVTLDTKIKYTDLFSSNRFVEDHDCVIEIKSEHSYIEDEIFAALPMPVERFSKYCRAIKLLNIQ